ncbi:MULTISPECIES: SCO family protein [unclassified Halomonas]|uniref:SCO family protein n=1 Tax=unclassified Halomonas TaxID=2609666 RepID=UPI0021E44525|nr:MULTISPECIES: SCO family protein [unclassified Halomonas]UYG01019.1 SCO family protein [Halomonas sp. GD1P12]WNL37919.1 SCO family protein [Halomonas sp. PAMB 3232]WNL41235.1 SCO family protein [Halomonas sp. PAMB 3264]
MQKVAWPLLAVALLAGCSDEEFRTTDIEEIMPPLQFSLTNDDGEPARAEEYRGKTTLVYFGYTQCPDVCPLTLARFASIFNELDDDERDDVQMLLISVDPNRDTPEVLKRYTDAFGPEFTGLTGDKEEIDALTNRYRIAYSFEEPNERGDYIVNHSSAVFAFNDEGQPRFLVRDPHSNQDVLADLRRVIDEG